MRVARVERSTVVMALFFVVSVAALKKGGVAVSRGAIQ